MARVTNPPPPEVRARGYEVDRVRLRWPVVAVIALVVIGLGLHFLLGALVGIETKSARSADRPASALPPLPASTDALLQPSLRHDRLPREDLAELRRYEDATFVSMGWQQREPAGAFVPPDELIREVAAVRASPSTRPDSEGGRQP